MSGGRIAQRFETLRADGRGGFVAYLTGGDPDIAVGASLVEALDRGGADIVELGVPFSDPLADGPTIQRGMERALASGTTLASVIALVREVRDRVATPIVLFSYANPILAYGRDRFVADAAAAGGDGLLVRDLPPAAMGDLHPSLLDAGIDPIFLISPTSSAARIEQAARLGRGFLYGISRLGVTGMRTSIATSAGELASRVRGITDMPLVLGFGVSTPEHVAEFHRHADAAVVGSALVDLVGRHAGDSQLPQRLESMVRWLRGEGPAPEDGDP
ncbi:MAG: tryptophan synthase subunit alpha [Phycisphaerales bacterium]